MIVHDESIVADMPQEQDVLFGEMVCNRSVKVENTNTFPGVWDGRNGHASYTLIWAIPSVLNVRECLCEVVHENNLT